VDSARPDRRTTVDEVDAVLVEEDDEDDEGDRRTEPDVNPLTRRVSVRVRSGSNPFSIILASASAVIVSSCGDVVESRPFVRFEDRRFTTGRSLDDERRMSTLRGEEKLDLEDVVAGPDDAVPVRRAVASGDWGDVVRSVLRRTSF
jgi:hypothetical protein